MSNYKGFDFRGNRRGFVTIEGVVTTVHYTDATGPSITEIYNKGVKAVELRYKDYKCTVIEYHYTPESYRAMKDEIDWLPDGTKVITKMAKATA